MKKIAIALAVLMGSIFFSAVLLGPKATALSGADWRAGRIIDAPIFRNNSSMSVQNIQDFLNAKVPSCDTWGTKPSEYGGGTRAQYGQSKGAPPPYTCLKDYSQNGRSAAQIIYDNSQQYRINPQVLLVLLQKEQALITDDWPLPIQYRSATGYGCPDTADCDSQYYGFDNQIRWAARMYQAISDNDPNWYSPYLPGNNFIRWNPISSCGGSNVWVESRATASLYSYTPYQPNATALSNLYGSQNDGCSSYGNRNFWRLFNDWFGPTLNNYDEIIRQGNYEGTYCPRLKATGYAYKVYCTSPINGDFNGDGFDDIAVLSIYPDKRSFNLWLFPGAADGLGNPVFQQHFSSSAYWNIAAIKPAAADLNHDGYKDLVMFAANGYDGITTVQLNGAPGGLKTAPNIRSDRQYTSDSGWRWSGLDVIRAGGDFNGDAYEDIAAISIFPDGRSFNLWLFPGAADGLANPVFQQHFSNTGYWDITGIKASTVNIDNDSYKDLVMFAANGYDGITTVQLKGSTGGLTGTPTIRGDRQYNPSSGWLWSGVELVRAGGKFNGDAYEDIAVLSIYPDKRSFNLWLFPGAADGISNPVLQRHFSSGDYWNIGNIKMTSGDLNHDGFSDLTMFASNAYDGITTVQIQGGANDLTSAPVLRTDRQYSPSSGWMWSGIR